MDPLELAALREREQRAAAEVVGYEGVTFLHMPDGALVNDLILREHLVREIRTFRPDAVLATDPETLFYRDSGVNHTDHRAAGFAAVDAVYPAARNPMAFPSLARGGLAAHRVRRLYLFWTEKPNAYVDTTATVDPQDRCPALPREPAQGLRAGGGVDQGVVGRARQADRRRGRRRLPRHRDRRGRRVAAEPGEAAEEGAAAGTLGSTARDVRGQAGLRCSSRSAGRTASQASHRFCSSSARAPTSSRMSDTP